MPVFGQIWPFFVPFRPMPVGTWDTLGIKIPKPPYISSLKMVVFVHFSNYFIPSEKYYKLQSCWITLYQLCQQVKRHFKSHSQSKWTKCLTIKRLQTKSYCFAIVSFTSKYGSATQQDVTLLLHAMLNIGECELYTISQFLIWADHSTILYSILQLDLELVTYVILNDSNFDRYLLLVKYIDAIARGKNIETIQLV